MRFGRSFPMPALLRGTPAKRVGIFTDTDVATVTLTASATEISQYVDAGTALVNITPSGADVYGSSIAATDTYTRTVSSGWGSADSGQTWVVEHPISGLFNNLEGGTNNTVITNANSGGASGDAFTLLEGDTTGIVYSSSHAAHGSLGLQMTYTTNQPFAGWSFTSMNDGYGRSYLYMQSAIVGSGIKVSGRLSGVFKWGILINAAGNVVIQNSAGNAIAIGSVVVNTFSWCRVEWHHNSTSQLVVRLFTSIDSFTPAETITAPSGTASAIDQVGISGQAAGGTTGWADDINVGATTWPGPTAAIGSTQSGFSTSGTVGTIAQGSSTATNVASLPVNIVDAYNVVDTLCTVAPTGTGYQFAHIYARFQDYLNFYRVILRYNTNNTIDAQVEKVVAGAVTTLSAFSQVVASASANAWYRCRFEVSGTNPTTLNVRVWLTSGSEPSTWSISTTDDPSSLTTAGSIALGVSKSSSVTNTPSGQFDNLTVSNVAASTPSGAYTDADTASVVTTAGIAVTPAETQQAVESGQATVTLTASGTDALAVLEPTVQATVTLTASGPDTLQTQDAVTATLSLTPSAVEIPAHFDAATASVTLTGSAVETTQIVEPTAGPTIALTASAIAEGKEFVDTNTANVVLSQPTVVEQAQFVDTSIVTLVLSPTAVEIPAHFDAATASVTVTAVTTQEGAVFVEAATANVTLTPSAADIAQYTDAAQAAVQVLASAVDVAQFVDTLRPTLILTASAVEAAQFVDSATANVVTTVSALAEGMVFIDSATGSVSLTASAVDIALRVDAATANVVLTGSATEFREVLDADTAFVNTTASAVTEGIVAEIFVVITPSGVEQYTPNDQDTAIVDLSNVTGVEVVALSSQDTAFVFTTAFSPDVSAFIDAGTATVNLLPSEITERRNIFDTNLIATVNARYSATELAPHIVGTLGPPHIVGTATARYVGAFEGLVPLVS